MAKVVNRLTQAEHFKLCKWVEVQEITTSTTLSSLAKEAPQVAFGAMPPSHIKGALLTLGITLPGPAKTVDEKLSIVIKALAELYVDLGKEPSKEFFDLVP